jgi:heat shock protein HtpX
MINQLKTIILLAVLTALMLFVGSLFGTSGFIVAIIFVLIFNGISYFFSHKIVLWIYKAKEADKAKYPDLYKTVDEVRRLANIPMPKVYIIPTESPNAFATGRGPSSGVVACTEGILKLLTKDELKGVIAHEISHIKNRDILVQTIAGMIAGVISYLATMFKWAAIFGRGDDDSGNFVALIVMAILAPIVATLIHLAISRSREYMADESAAKMLRNGKGLSDALIKLEKGIDAKPLQYGSPSTASIFISSPFGKSWFMTILSTHPSTEKRVEKLKAMRF